MSLRRKLEGEAEIGATAADVLHDLIKSKPHHVSQVASHFIQSVDLHEGDHGQVGTVTLWKYALGGKPLEAKAVLEEIDEEKKYVKYRVIEGDIMKDYKNFSAACQVIPKNSETCIVKWIFEYQKMHSGIPEPSDLFDAWLEACQILHDHHHGINK